MDINDFRIDPHGAVRSCCFLGIVVWAYSGRTKRRFEEAANLPFTEDDVPASGREHGLDKEKHHERFRQRILELSTSPVIIALSILVAAPGCCYAEPRIKRTGGPVQHARAMLWDENLQEYNNPAAALVDVAVLHHHRVRASSTWSLYPGFGTFPGRLRAGVRRASTRPR
ncbi:MAG: cbb3-type cytochrome c oxidase subunit 3 [Comamonadaceae bacterium]|nr:cbb3-type cytochrome c oxidase subunit 3 [Comamonadaceae bacterium]